MLEDKEIDQIINMIKRAYDNKEDKPTDKEIDFIINWAENVKKDTFLLNRVFDGDAVVRFDENTNDLVFVATKQYHEEIKKEERKLVELGDEILNEMIE